MKNPIEQLSVQSLIVNHFYVGVLITLFYVWVGPLVIDAGLPGMSVLLLAEVIILAPIVFIHLMVAAKKSSLAIGDVILFKEKLPAKSFIFFTLLGILACMLVYIPLYPVGIFLRQTWFAWLPEWYFNPFYGTKDTQLIAYTFLIAIFIDGLIGPVAEELFFRGYLLPRMAFLKNWAPIANGALFGLYHFWQPHNFIAIIAVGIVLSFAAWKTRNVYLSMAIHCSINILGALGGFLAVSGELVMNVAK